MVTTTETIGSSVVRCGRCGREARGGVLVDGRAGCCLQGLDLEIWLGMVEGSPEPGVPPPAMVAHDPFLNRTKGVHPVAGKVIAAIREKRNAATTDEERRRYGAAYPEVVAEVLAEGGFEPEPAPVPPASIPPPPGEPDEVLAGIRPPLGAPKRGL